MKSSKQKWINAIIVLSMLVGITGAFILVVTFGGSSTSPDATLTYTKHNLAWDLPLDDNDAAILNIFGEPEAGEELPLIHPSSKGKYYVRLNNDVTGNIGYSVYLYCENAHAVPLTFSITRTTDMKETDNIPSDLANMQVLDKVSGYVKAKSMENFEIDWFWDSESDAADTALGDKAVLNDLKYTIHMLVVVEDNNSYYVADSSGNARLLHRAYVYGYPEGDFRPDGNTLRSETTAIFARILANYEEEAFVDTESSFTDVAADAWHAKYVSYLEGADIIKGYPDGSFGPNDTITRAEFVTICVRYFEKTVGKIQAEHKEFADLDKTHWAYDAVQKAVAQEYITGYPDNTVRPDEKITRAEVVTVVNRMLERSADKKCIDSNADTFIQFTDLQDKTHWAYYDIFEAANTHHLRKAQENEYWITKVRI